MTIAPATSEIPKNPTVRREWIGFQMRIRGVSLRSLARQEGVSHQAVSAAAAGAGSRHLQQAIADLLGLAVAELFPELHDGNGARTGRTRQRRRKAAIDGKGALQEDCAA